MSDSIQTIQPSTARQDVLVTLPGGICLSGPMGRSLEAFLRHALDAGLLSLNAPLIAATVNGRLRELNYVLEHDANIEPVTLASRDGGRIYRRSLVFLMTTAIDELWPSTKVSIKYAVPDGGFFCEITNRLPLSAEEIGRVEEHMRAIVAEDSAITKRIVALEEAVRIFQERGDVDKVRLLDYRMRRSLTLYSLRDIDEYYFGYMVPSTKYLSLFRLIPVNNGFILQYPRQESPYELLPITTYNKLSTVFHQADEWLERLNIEDVGRLNRLVRDDRLQEIILVSEAFHEQNIAQTAQRICQQHEAGLRIVLIAGPSSSGKTTFAKRLSIQLLALGLRPFTLEIDNYFVDREHTPLDENGDYDFEALEALNLEQFNTDLMKLLNGEVVQLPRFNFKAGRSERGRIAQISPKHIIVMEGIHGLNPGLVPRIPQDVLFRVYVSALTQLNIDMHNRVPTTDVRLLRRIVRDARTRGWQAIDTLSRWNSVRRGEKRNIFPHQENADVMFNSALAYELGALRPLAEPLLLQVPLDTPQYLEANRLLSFLRWVQPMSNHQMARIPDTSILREFIGNSILDDYHPGEETFEQSNDEHG